MWFKKSAGFSVALVAATVVWAQTGVQPGAPTGARPGVVGLTTEQTALILNTIVQNQVAAVADTAALMKAMQDRMGETVGSCKTHVEAQDRASAVALDSGSRTRELSPFEVQAYGRSRQAIMQPYAQSAKTGLTLKVCQDTLVNMQAEHAKLLSAMKPMVVPECMQRVDSTGRELQATFESGFRAGAITPAEQIIFMRDQQARVIDWVRKSQGGLTADECRDHLNGVEAQALAVKQMASGR